MVKSFEHSLNASSAILVMVTGTVTSLRSADWKKVNLSIPSIVSLSGILTAVSPVAEKAYTPIFFRLAGSSMDFRFLQSQKALLPITLRFFDSFTLLRFLLEAKA